MGKVNEPMPQVKTYVNKLKQKFPSQLAHVNRDRILYTSFSRKSSRALAKIGPIPATVSRFLPGVEYNLQVHLQSWNDSSQGRKMYVILHQLTHIPQGGFTNSSKQYKKVIRHDVQDFRCLIRKYGIDMQKTQQLAK